jgi:hypothetical protein
LFGWNNRLEECYVDEAPVKSDYAMDQIQFGIFGAGIVTRPTQNPGSGDPSTGQGGCEPPQNPPGNQGGCDQCDGGAAGVLRLI